MNRFILGTVLFLAVACSRGTVWEPEEARLINADDSLMRVLSISNEIDSLFLRMGTKDIEKDLLFGEVYNRLAEKMVATVTSPEQDGVGIAGPQVGIGRRIVAVMRYDKEGKPFEVYPNIRIVATRGDLVPGPEGCLSVPNRRGEVLRYRDIDIAYSTPSGDTIETVQGFSAVIFQHEIDHLDGVLYIDKIQ